MTPKPRHLTEFRHLIVALKRKLPDAEARFNEDATVPMRQVYLRGLPAPTPDEALRSDYGIPSNASEKKVTDEFWREIEAIEECLKESNFEVTLADWQKGTQLEQVQRMYKGMNLRAYALQFWDWYAIPFRYFDGRIFVVWAPDDVMGTPIVHSYNPQWFLFNLALRQTKDEIESQRQSKKLQKWFRTVLKKNVIKWC